MENMDAEKLMLLYIHDYLVKRNLPETADEVAKDANLNSQDGGIINTPEGLLFNFFSIFYKEFCAEFTKPHEVPEDVSSSSEGFVEVWFPKFVSEYSAEVAKQESSSEATEDAGTAPDKLRFNPGIAKQVVLRMVASNPSMLEAARAYYFPTNFKSL